MSSDQAWPAPAKINLFLHITGRRQDGYHELQTVFQFLDYADELFFRVRDDRLIRRVSPLPGVDPEQDLTLRAARRLQAAGAVRLGVDIDLRKRIPMGAGLGGGSSDAATVLVALNHLWGLRLSRQELSGIAIELGADVPIFIFGQAAWAEGVGERLRPVEPEQPWYVLVVPNCHIQTAKIFAAPELTRNSPPLTIDNFVSGFGRNDCETVVRDRYPEVGEVLDWFGPSSRLTGTGSCVFCSFGSEAEATARLASLPQRWQGFVAKGSNRSPLFARLGNRC
ncbi:MAG: 4-(cytidine 5'-diphospho)-2-C-methyl-D-erythritol kinase [Gammaproteobacteria bacterium]